MKNSRSASIAVLSIALACAGCDAQSPDPTESPAAEVPSASTGADLTYEEIVALFANPDPFEIARTLGERLPPLGPGSLPAIKTALDDAADLEIDAAGFELLMRYWAIHEPGEATFYALARAPRAYRVAAIHATMRPWAKKEPKKAMETVGLWASEGGDGGAAIQTALVRGWYDSGQPGLEDYIHHLGESFERQRAIVVYATEMIRDRRIDEVIRWAESLPEGDEAYKIDVFRGVATSLVVFDLPAAKRFCDAHCEGPFGWKMRDRIASAWLRKDGVAALEWLSTAPESGDRDPVIRINYSLWADREPEKALRWMDEKRAQNPQPSWVGMTEAPYARVLGKIRPEEGLAATERIAGPFERETTAVRILREWRQRDEAAAEAWMQKNPLPPELAERVRMPPTIPEEKKEEKRHREAAFPKD
jgi:hypothetical protein